MKCILFIKYIEYSYFKDLLQIKKVKIIRHNLLKEITHLYVVDDTCTMKQCDFFGSKM